MEISEAFEAIKLGDLTKLSSLPIQQMINTVDNSTDEIITAPGKTMLYYACEIGCAGIVQYLLTIPGVDTKNGHAMIESPLYIACKQGHVEVVELLISDNRVDPQYGYYSSYSYSNCKKVDTPLCIACENKHYEVVKLLLMSTRVDVNQGRSSNTSGDQPSSTTETPLYCSRGDIEMVKLLLTAHNIDVNKGYIQELTTSSYYSYNRNNGINDKKTVTKRSPLYQAQPEVAMLLIQHPDTDINTCSEVTGDNHIQRQIFVPIVEFCDNIDVVKCLLAKNTIDVNRNSIEDRGHSKTQKNALSEACRLNKMEVIQLLLDHDAEINDTAINQALLKNINLNSLKIASIDRRFGLKRFNIKKCNRDCIQEKIYAFKPLISKIVPSLFEMVINNEALINVLTENQTQILQQLIDNILYNGTIQLENTVEFNLDMLFILEKVYGDYTEIKQLALKSIVSHINLSNVLDVLDILDKYISIHNNTEVITTGKQTNILSNLKEYCLNFIASKTLHPDFEKHVENDSRIDKYLKTLLKRKTVNPFEIKEDLVRRPISALTDLLKDGSPNSNYDIELQIGNDKVKCHKTILETKSTFFETLFQGSWNNIQDVYPPETLFIIQYCYGITPIIPVQYLIPLLKKAHEHEILELISIVENQMTITEKNFFEWIEVMENYKEEPKCESIIQKLITFGAINATRLFNAKILENFDPIFKDQIFLRIINRR